MTNSEDIRWKQRFQNFESAFLLFKDSVKEFGDTKTDIIKEGIIQRFEFTHELAWKVMKDYLTFEGVINIMGSRSATREAFNKGLITDGNKWMNMLETRNLTVRTYNVVILKEQFIFIRDTYLPLIEQFYLKMKEYL